MAQELDEILLGFVEEMEGYIPAIRDGVVELRQHPDNRPVLDEMHRLMHIVKGAAAMLGVDPLSQAAKSMELALDHVRTGDMRLGDELLDAVQRAVELFERYSVHLRSGGPPDDPELLALVAEICDRAEALPHDGAGGGAASSSRTGGTTPSGVELDDELMASFVEEANEHFADIHNALRRLETLVTAPVPMEGEVAELTRGLRRSAHTIKGASAVIGLRHIADVGRVAEDVLEWFAESAREMEPDHVAIISQLLAQLDNVARNPDNYDAEMVEDCLTLLAPLMAGEGAVGAAASEEGDAAALLDDGAAFLDEPADDLLADAEGAVEDEALFAADATETAAAPAESPAPSFAEEAPSFTPSGIELDDELLAAFTEEVDEHFEGINTALHSLEGLVETTTPVQGEVSEQLRGIRRFVHTVKGASAVIGLQHIADVGHRIEDVLDWFYESASEIAPEELGVLARVLDQFENLVRTPSSYDAALVDDGLALLRRKMTDGAASETAGAATRDFAPEAATGDAADALLGDESAFLDESSALLADGDATFPEDATDATPEAASPAPPAMTPSGIELDDELLAAFTEEVNEHFDGISTALHSLEGLVETTTPVQGEVSEQLRGIRRFVHTVKGASAVIGLQHIADVGHRIEDVLDWFYESASEIGPEELGVLAQVLDQFENLVRSPSAYDAALVDDGLALLRRKMADGATAGAVAAAGDAADALLGEESSLLDASSDLLADGEASFPEDATTAASAAASSASPAMTPSGIELDDELLAAFTEEVNEHFEGISAALHSLEGLVETTTPVQGEVSEQLRGIRRFVHTVKGASAVIGLQHIADVGHRIEDVLDWFYESATEIGPEELDVLARVLDQYENLVRTPDAYDAAVVDDGLTFLGRRMTEAPVGAVAATPAPSPEEDDATETAAEADAGAPSVSASLFSEEEQRMLREGFMEEADEHLQELSRSMQTLESRVNGAMPMDADLKEEVRTIRRAVHTIKGASAVIGITDISGYAHKVEDFLDWLFEKAEEIDPDIVSLVAESVDMLGSIVENPASVGESRREDMFARLAAVSAGGAPEVSAAAPAMRGDAAAARLSAEELELMRRSFAEEADVYVEKTHHRVQAVAACLGEDGPLSPAAREELGKLQELVQSVQKTAAILGNGDVSAPTADFARFLEWLRGADIKVRSTVLVDVLADAADIMGRLMDKPDEVSWERIDDVMDKLDDIRRLDPSGGGLPRSQHIDRQALARLASASESRVVEQRKPQVKQETRPAAPAAKAGTTEAAASAAAEAAKTIRIHQNQLDKFINLANELLVGVSGFDRNMSRFQGALEELDLAVRRLKGIALELETKFEVKALDALSFHFDRIEQARQEIQAETSLASLDEFDAMELDHYTQLNLIIRALNESAVDVAALHTNLENIHNGLGVDISRQHRVVRELQVQLMRARLSPMSMLTPRLSRTMRDVAARLQKRVRLVMEGDTVELDRVIWEKLADPFMHLVRNSVHHGIEEAKEREAAGKPAIATIKIAGAREGHHVVIRYSDDGRGLNIAAIRERARRNMGDAVDELDEDELVDLIFTPGFSTQKVVTQISGRGVGMDVVKQNVQDLQGAISVSTAPGRGTEFAIRVPLTLGVVRALLVEVDQVTYGIALNEIRDIHRIDRRDIAEDGRTFQREGNAVALYNLPLLLGREIAAEDLDAPQPLVFTIESEGELSGVRIPHIAGQKEVVLKGLGSHLRAVTGIAGAAVMGDGTVIPLLNVAELVAAYRMREEEHPEELVRRKEEKPKALTVMIVDDSISIRRVMSRLVANHSWIPVEAKDGQDAFEKLDAVRPDCILLDIEMPRMNGYEFLALKANLPEHKHIPVIMLTSRTSDKHRNKAMELGASVFLNKPPKDEEFVDAVLRLTGHGRSREQIRQWEGAR